MEKLSLCLFKGLIVNFIFCSSNVNANPEEKGEFNAVYSLVANVNQQNVEVFRAKTNALLEKLRNMSKKSNKKGKLLLKIAYLSDLLEIVKKVLRYQQNADEREQLGPELDVAARTYGGNVHRLIWPVLHPHPGDAQ
ncbi:MAG: hypothetical protein LBB05_02105 [Puniceicoccales bacterium]|jgi:hypothetical protein|nr:hypothetical protein [Puniceicoccales bacterium]